MKKIKRIVRNKPSVIAREKDRVEMFCLNQLKPDGQTSLKVSEVFESYRVWVKGMGYRTVISIDSFGRLLPKSYKRSYETIGGTNHRMIVGMKLSSFDARR